MNKIAIAACVVLVSGCSRTEAQQQKLPSATDVVATVGTASITLAQVDEKALDQPVSNFGSAKLGQALYDARRQALDELVANTLMDQEAKKRGVDRPSLIEKEITSKISPVNDTDVTSWYQANQGRLQGASLDQVRAPIRAYLIQERMGAVRDEYVDTLRAKTAVHILLEPPRLRVAAATGAAKGPSSAPIEMIEFSDFQCPFCQRAHATVERVLTTYGNNIRFVYRHYPVPGHANAKPAAEASECAKEQGKFWPYHDRLFANPSKLSDADLKQHAASVGLDTTAFNACFDSHKYASVVDADAKDGEAAGVNGTPAFYINGRMVSGAQPFDVFKRIIDDELQRKSKG